MKIVLLPVPEYPISQEKDAEESAQEPDASLYKEDGSLEIEYASLIDVRLLKGYNSDNLRNEKSKEKARSNNWDLAVVDANPRHSAALLAGSYQVLDRMFINLLLDAKRTDQNKIMDDVVLQKRDQPWGGSKLIRL
ncbi:hypothetical protein BHM03_00004167 [Ensete ventricosum]|nr:hypothetical protein BHM03_00004167 [Ensete ventricosum]